ncbi:MAG: Holliday junction resolvase RuvX [Betaproteobacteria bacterium]|nr:Holliday junction resolvase RuvX [Betaproteobacteria bacterium]
MPDAAMRSPPRRARPSPATPAAAVADGGTLLAFDFGEKRIGVAIGEIETGLAHALPGIDGERNDVRFAAIARLFSEWRPARVVVGLPLATDGSAHAITVRARRFARQLEGRFRLPVVMVDERYTSVEAESRERADPRAGGYGIDSGAAQLILQQYLQERGR